MHRIDLVDMVQVQKPIKLPTLRKLSDSNLAITPFEKKISLLIISTLAV